MTKISKSKLNRKASTESTEFTLEPGALREAFGHACHALLGRIQTAAMSLADMPTFAAFVREVRLALQGIGRGACELFLALAHQTVEREREPGPVERCGARFKASKLAERGYVTWFGLIRYARGYMRRVGGGAGFHPLDEKLGIVGDRISPDVLSLGVRLSTSHTFDEARRVMALFLPEVPSSEVLQNAAQGFGEHTQDFFAQLPAPEDDGEVLVIQIDSKGIPTATQTELEKRRGPRPRRAKPRSRRQRNRARRQRCPQKRRKPGDKSKNAKMGTMAAMYTLKRDGEELAGPHNVRRYFSLAPKRHAFEVAVREAKKRGFGPNADGNYGDRTDGRLVQVLIDGDTALERYARELFPGAEVTIDVMHVLGYVWTAAGAIFRRDDEEGEKASWFELQRERLYGGAVVDVTGELRSRLAAVPKTGPGTKRRRDSLSEALGYIENREPMLGYADLIRRDLEIGTGVVEGAIKHVIGKRFDNGGMRWIRERAEALVQMRCIDLDGLWESFETFVAERVAEQAASSGKIVRIQQRQPCGLPEHVRSAA